MTISESRSMNTPDLRILCAAVCGMSMLFVVAAPSPCSAQAVLLTVGPHGAYPTIQGALSGVVNGGINDLRIETGTFVENVVINFWHGELHISGGWDPTFATQTTNASLTVIDGNGVDRCLFLARPAATSPNTKVSISNLTLTGGEAMTGGGVYFRASGNLQLEISDCHIDANTAETSVGSPYGGGLYADISGSGNSLWVHDSRIEHNLCRDSDAGGGTARGGGAYVEVSDLSPVTFERVRFVSNQAEAVSEIGGAGLYLRVDTDAVASVTDNEFINNQAMSSASPQVTGTGLDVTVYGWAKVFRNKLFINSSQTGNGSQLQFLATGSAQLRAGDTVVAGGDEGVGASVRDTALLALTNLTSVNNTDSGLSFYIGDPTATASVHNSVFHGNGTDLTLQQGNGTIANSHNLVGVDPVFVNPAVFDFRLSAGSPAENAGTNSPPAGLGDADCDGAVRVIAGAVDMGAYEGVDVLFSDGFALRTRRWSDVVGD